MLLNRLIACILSRDCMVVQSRQFKHTNIVGNAFTSVDFWNAWSIDEIVLLDVSKTDERREKFHEFLEYLSKVCFLPLTVGGRITDVEEARRFLHEGADKIVVNSEAFENPDFIRQLATAFGSQCVVVSIDYKDNLVHTDRGAERRKVTPVGWAKLAEECGAGEIFLTSIEHDGMLKGYDLDTIHRVSRAVNIPVVASGGVGKWEHLADGLVAGADAVSVANAFHYTEQSTKKARQYLLDNGFQVRSTDFYLDDRPREIIYDNR